MTLKAKQSIYPPLVGLIVFFLLALAFQLIYDEFIYVPQPDDWHFGADLFLEIYGLAFLIFILPCIAFQYFVVLRILK